MYCLKKICDDIHVPEKNVWKTFWISYNLFEAFFNSQKYNYYTTFLEARQNSDEDSWDWFLYKFIKLVLNNWGTYFNNKQMTINGNRRRQGNCVGMRCIFGNGCTIADHFVLWWKNPGTDYQKGQIGQIRCPPSPVGTPN